MKQFLSSPAGIVACAAVALPYLGAAQTAPTIPPNLVTPSTVETRTINTSDQIARISIVSQLRWSRVR